MSMIRSALPMVADGSEPHYANELMAMFMASLTQTLAEIESALTLRDHVRLRRVVHSLKSSAATVGAVELAALAEANEYRLRKGLEPAPELYKVMSQAVSRLRLALPDDLTGETTSVN